MDEFDFEFDVLDEAVIDKVYVLIIYDIVNSKKRNKLAKFLQGYGFRIQKSCFEAKITSNLYNELKREIGKFASAEDSIRVYKIIGKGQVTCYGNANIVVDERDVIIW